MELTAEIFAVGRWNGFEFSLVDLQRIAETFKALGDKHRVPLKFGHNNEQPMTDGQPALGWVTDVWVAGEKLMAKFSDIPEIVFNAMQKKLYNNVSVELDFDVKWKEQQFPMVLSGVALLGGDLPAVNTLKDLTHYMSRQDAEFRVGRKAAFSAIAGNNSSEEQDMNIEELSKQVAKLSASVDAMSAKNDELTKVNLELTAKVQKYEADAKAKEAADEKARLEAKRAEVTATMEAGVKAGAITPAQREQFTKLLRIDSDEALNALDMEAVKQFATANGKVKFSKESGMERPSGAPLLDLSNPAATAAAEARAIVAKGEAKNLQEATVLLFSRHPDLGRAYANMNMEV